LDRVYSEESSFFGGGPIRFAKKCNECFIQNVKKNFDLGCGQTRYNLFFPLNAFDVYAAGSPSVAVDGLRKHCEKTNLPINAKCVDARQGLPYEDSYLDPIHAHMFFQHGLYRQKY
jgi:hypothetical protein